MTEADVYLDPPQPIGQGFDYAVASSGADGARFAAFGFPNQGRRVASVVAAERSGR